MPLSLSDIIDVVVNVSPVFPARSTFNHGLIIGSTAVVSVVERLRVYTSTNAMITDGFSNSNPEYLAAQLYFSQSPAPTQLWIGRQNLSSTPVTANTAITITSPIITPSSMTGIEVGMSVTGTGIPSGATIISKTTTTFTLSANATVTNASASLTYATISISATAAITTSSAVVTPVSMTGVYVGQTVTGTGIPANSIIISVTTTTFTMNNNATATNVAASLTLYNTDSILTAVQACRLANNDWYTCMACGSVTSDHLVVAAYIETATPSSTYMYTTTDAAVLNNTGGNIMLTLKGLSYGRNLGLYSTQTTDAVAALLGVAMGLNTGLANSAYTLKFKTLVGVTAEPLTQTQVNNIEGNNGNVYVNYTGGYIIAEQGTMSNGQFYDEVINLDMLSNGIQLNVMNVLISNPKVPLTDAGITQLLRAVNQACDVAVNIGFLAPGIWTGVQVLNLNTGDPVTKGYVTQAPAVSTMTSVQRTARQSPPIYACITEAGAVHSVLIGVYVQR
jgi:hypothetical protein